MPPNRTETRNKHQRTNEDAMADCVLPEEIMLCILTCLPVKSILRFKSVCKPWLHLFSTPDFVRMHRHHITSDPKNESFILCCVSRSSLPTLSLFTIDSKPSNLGVPYRRGSLTTFPVGCCNGLVCLYRPPFEAVLWNPATRLSKTVRLPVVENWMAGKVSLGFGYDSERDDFKVVRIVSSQQGQKKGVAVEVYSAKSHSWEAIKNLAFLCGGWRHRNDAIVNGNPYWVAAKVGENESEVLVWCDVTKLEVKMAPLLPTLKPEERAEATFVDWKGSLAALVCSKINEERLGSSVDVWVFDGGEIMWRKNCSFGPIEMMKVERCLHFSENGRIVGQCVDGKLFVFDSKNGWIKEVENEVEEGSLNVYGYNESLVYIKGMERAEKRRRRREGRQ